MPPSLYETFLTTELQLNGSETTVYVNSLDTLTGEQINFANFSPFTRGIIVIDPESVTGSQPEIISFTGIDTINSAFTGCTRGLSSITATTVAANKVYHGTNSPVVISWGAQNISDLIAYVQSLVTGSLGTASNTVFGSTKVTLNMGTKPRARSAIVSEQTPPVMTVLVNPFATVGPAGLVVYAGGSSSTITAPISNPRVDLVVYNVNSSALALRTGSEGSTPSTPSPTDGDIVLCEVYNRVGETSIKENDDSTNGYIRRWYELTPFAVYPPSGSIHAYGGTSAPTGYLNCDGSAVSRATYAPLFTAISTTWGAGDGSTTFNVPDLRGRVAIGAGTGTRVATIASISGNVFTVTGLTNAHNNEFQTGEAIVFAATTAGNLTNAATYYVIKTGNLTFSVTDTLAHAQNGTNIITLAGTEAGTFTLTLTTRTIGDFGGEENHAMNSTELLAHTNSIGTASSAGAGSVSAVYNSATATNSFNSGSTGGNAAMNIMQPFASILYIIKT
jgi:microcystin-dependent protein